MEDDEGYEKQESTMYWNPQAPGESLKGKIAYAEEGEYGMSYTIELDDKSLIKTPAHKVLLSRMTKAKAGDRVKITFTGEELPKVKGQNPTKMYEVGLKQS